MKLWLDDVRPMPDGFDLHCFDAASAIDALMKGDVTHISFDHDLGDSADGYQVAKFIESGAYTGILPPLWWTAHSANPVGCENIRRAMYSAERFWLNRQDDSQC